MTGFNMVGFNCARAESHGVANVEPAVVSTSAFMASPSCISYGVFNSQEFAGFGVWDSGATSSMGGVNGLQAILNAYWDVHDDGAGLAVNKDIRLEFSFANGESDSSLSMLSLTRWMHTRTRSARAVTMSFAVFDRPSPILLGLDIIRALGVEIDFKNGRVFSPEHNIVFPTVILPSGHLAWDLRPNSDDATARGSLECGFQACRLDSDDEKSDEKDVKEDESEDAWMLWHDAGARDDRNRKVTSEGGNLASRGIPNRIE